MALVRGLSVSIYRNAEFRDCSLGGVSAVYDQATIITVPNGPNQVDLMDEFDALGNPILRIVRERGGICVVPNGYQKIAPGFPCFGGNFVYSSDSRFSALSPGPIAIHDRDERLDPILKPATEKFSVGEKTLVVRVGEYGVVLLSEKGEPWTGEIPALVWKGISNFLNAPHSQWRKTLRK